MDETPERTRYTFALDGSEIVLGRAPESDVVLLGLGVSRRHATIRLERGGPTVCDAGSTFGIRVDDKPVTEWTLTDGCRLTVGIAAFHVSVTESQLVLERQTEPSWPALATEGIAPDTIRIGRDTVNEIRLSHPLVSRHHCTLTRSSPTTFTIADAGSTNGTFINGRAVRHGELRDGDILQVGPFRFILDKGSLTKAEDSNRIKLEAFDVTVVRRGKTLLDRVSLSIQPGEFVAILGPSGAGKTTLALALTGQIPVTGGGVFFSGLPLKQFMGAFSGSVGFVSQHNLVRPELTVGETFREQCRLRLPRDSLPAERDERIDEVMRLLDLRSVEGSRISAISGGETKRVHLGIELLSSPTVVFLDEPLAGLDPGLVQKFMELFRELARRGHTILLTTHLLDQMGLCDRALFIEHGQLTYDGPPQGAAAELGGATLAEVYENARKRKSSAGSRRRGDDPKRKEMVEYGIMPQTGAKYRPRALGLLPQLALLVPRYARIVSRDRRNAALLLSQPPLIAVLLGLVFKHENTYLPLSFYFCLTISSIWIGGVNAVREIAREWHLFEREFRVGLSCSAYLASKGLVFVALGLVQSLLFALCLDLLFKALHFGVNIVALLGAAAGCGALLGLCVSAFSSNVNQAVSWLPIVFIPQIFFSGILIPFDRMAWLGRFLSHLTIARPVFSLFKRAWVLEQPLWSPEGWSALGWLSTGLCILAYLRVRWRRLW